MAKEIEKSILQELKRFSEINHNSDNLNEHTGSAANTQHHPGRQLPGA